MRRPIPAALTIAFVGLALPNLSGCGLIFGGTSQTISVQSSPNAATVTTTPATGTYTTPSSISLSRKNSYSLKFEKQGYSSADFEIHNHVRGGIVVLDILVGLVGVIIDAATGAWYGLSPDNANVVMTKVGMVDGPDTITVGIRIGHTGDSNTLNVQSSVPGVLVRVEPAPAH
jgi:hypothetical protein